MGLQRTEACTKVWIGFPAPCPPSAEQPIGDCLANTVRPEGLEVSRQTGACPYVVDANQNASGGAF